MLKQLVIAGGLLSLTAGSALAIGPECGAQLNSLDALISQHPDRAATVKDRRDQAQQLCAQGKDMESQELLRQVREEIGGASGSSTSGSGTSGSGTSATGGSQAPRK
ncbi:MAG TPA: hypothetical protein VGD08_11750 [Stellaceae bacterium]|jgi:hypothetical protein